MNTLVAFYKKLHLSRVFAVLAASLVLVLNVACSNGNNVGARPNNPPVQMGGQNNPHKAGGDGYSEYKMSTDPAVNEHDRASVLKLNQLIAMTDEVKGRSFSERDNQASSTSRQSETLLKEVRKTPEPRQDVFDRSDPNAKLLEKVGGAFKEASKHLTGSTAESIEQSGVKQSD